MAESPMRQISRVAVVLLATFSQVGLKGPSQAQTADSVEQRMWKADLCDDTPPGRAFESSKNQLLRGLKHDEEIVVMDGRPYVAGRAVHLTQEQWDDLNTSLACDRLSSPTIQLLRELVQKRHGYWSSAYNVLAEFGGVSGECPGLANPLAIDVGDELVGVLILARTGSAPDPVQVRENLAKIENASRRRDPAHPWEVSYWLDLRFRLRTFLEGPERTEVVASCFALSLGVVEQRYPIYSSWRNLIGADETPLEKVRRQLMGALVMCPHPADHEGLLLALAGINAVFERRWRLDGGASKSLDWQFSGALNEFVETALVTSRAANRPAHPWLRSLDNDLMALEDEIRRSQIDDPSREGEPDARPGHLAQLAEVRAYIAPRLQDALEQATREDSTGSH